MSKEISEKWIDLIIKFEGFSAKPYLCPAGVPTIGYGSTYYTDGRKVTLDDKPIAKERARYILCKQVNDHYGKAVNRYVQVEITQNQFDALCSFAYNVGVGNLKSSTLLKKLNNGDYEGASNEFLKWTRSKGKVLNGLARRREAEKKLFDS